MLGAAAQDLTITTFHALGLRLIKQWSRELGYGHAVPAVYGRDDARALLRQAAAGFGIEIVPETPGREQDPWSMPLSKLALALDRFRLGYGGGRTDVDNDDDIDDQLLESQASRTRHCSTAWSCRLPGHVDAASPPL